MSFLNIGHHVASPDHNFLVFGGNCSENNPDFISMVKKLVDGMGVIEDRSFTIRAVDVNFRLSLAPSDMKFLAILAGELTNSATYPCTFAKIKKEEFSSIEKSKIWSGWTYEQRMIDVENVAKYKKSLPQNHKGNRSKITKYIASLGSRQEFEPLLGKYVEKVKAEPLHLKNNGWQQWHFQIFQQALIHTPDSFLNKSSEIQDLPGCIFKGYYQMLKSIKLGKVARKISSWFSEDRKKNKPLELRFTGEESLKVSRNFMRFIDLMYNDDLSDASKLKLHVLAYVGYQLRESVALFSRFQISEADIKKLSECSQLYYRACALFLNVTLTTWTIGNVVPIHTRECYSEFGLGLAINTMQGREAKHLRLREYTKKATVLNRWNMAFRHEYMSTIWLNENDPSCSNIKMSVEEFTQKEFQNHIPKIFTNSEVYCYCGITKTDGNCAYCTHTLRADIESSCKKGKIEQALKM